MYKYPNLLKNPTSRILSINSDSHITELRLAEPGEILVYQTAIFNDEELQQLSPTEFVSVPVVLVSIWAASNPTTASPTNKDTLIGMISMSDRSVRVNEHSLIQLGITIWNRAYWGKGFGTDAIKQIIEYLFIHENTKRVQLKLLRTNIRAYKCYLKCGFDVIRTDNTFIHMCVDNVSLTSLNTSVNNVNAKVYKRSVYQ